MSLHIQPLLVTMFRDLDVRGLHIAGRMPQERHEGQWKAVIDDRRSILLTQLVGSPGEMRDGVYYYLMAVSRRLYLLESGPGTLRIVRSALDGSYPPTGPELDEHEILSLGREGIRMLFEYHRKSPAAPHIVGADGRPIGSPRGDV
jgi:hypothetical protein